MSKHTPGPWSAIRTPESSYFDYQVQVGRDRVGVYSEADARLIAAAPELLAACEAMSAHYSASLDYQPAYVRVAREAIEAATGSTHV